jgi:hypothetical protein
MLNGPILKREANRPQKKEAYVIAASHNLAGKTTDGFIIFSVIRCKSRRQGWYEYIGVSIVSIEQGLYTRSIPGVSILFHASRLDSQHASPSGLNNKVYCALRID